MNETFWIAIYGAGLSSILGLLKIISFLREKGKVKLKIVIDETSENNKLKLIIIIIKYGNKPVTIEGIGDYRAGEYYHTFKGPEFPIKLVDEGDRHIERIVDISMLAADCIYAFDSLGKRYDFKGRKLRKLRREGEVKLGIANRKRGLKALVRMFRK